MNYMRNIFLFNSPNPNHDERKPILVVNEKSSSTYVDDNKEDSFIDDYINDMK